MKLEDEIKQGPAFKSEYHKVVVNLILTHSYVTTLVKDRLVAFDVTLQQYNLLRILRGQYPNAATINLLRERMLDKMSDASRIVDRLVKKELVSRNLNKIDRRAADIIISDKGLDLLAQLDPIINPDDVLSQHLSSDDVAVLNDLLDKLRG